MTLPQSLCGGNSLSSYLISTKNIKWAQVHFFFILLLKLFCLCSVLCSLRYFAFAFCLALLGFFGGLQVLSCKLHFPWVICVVWLLLLTIWLLFYCCSTSFYVQFFSCCCLTFLQSPIPFKPISHVCLVFLALLFDSSCIVTH